MNIPQTRCENCGNHSNRIFTIMMNGKSHIFDSFECAIHKIGPKCNHCNTIILGHGVDRDGSFYCCNHCANSKFEEDITVDHLIIESGR